MSTQPAGLITLGSKYAPKETMDRLIAAVTTRGMAVLARVDHAAAAHTVGLELRPTEVVLFGNPKAGTPLMQAVQTIGIDLPLKALVWQDADQKTWLSYNDPNGLAARHEVHGTDAVLKAMTAGLAAIAAEATGAD